MYAAKMIRQYLWILRTVHNTGGVTLEELNRYWVSDPMSDGRPIPRSTFHRYREAIEEIFGLRIVCRANKDNKYYIEGDGTVDELAPEQWITDSLAVNSVLLQYLGLSSRIQLEPIPCDGDLLRQVIVAMQHSMRIRIIYQKYTTDEPREHLLEPYCAKLFSQRWYVLAKDEGVFKMFSLDRIKRLDITNQVFTLPSDFNADAFFSECFGVFLGTDKELQRVVIRAFGTQVKYTRDLPWHHSQKEIATTDDYSDFEYLLRPTIDFSNHILSWGNRVQVLEPQWLAEHVKKRHDDAAKLYE